MSEIRSRFSTEIKIRFRDCDALGHVNNAVYLTYFEMAREEFWSREVGNRDYPFILAEASVTFKTPARHGQIIRVEIGVEKIGTKSWTFNYRITDATTGSEIAVGRSVQVAYDYATATTVPISEKTREKLQKWII